MTAARRRRAAPVATRVAPAKLPKPEQATPVRPVERIGIAAAVEQMTPEFIACRDYGHSWEPFTVNWNPTDRFYQQQLK